VVPVTPRRARLVALVAAVALSVVLGPAGVPGQAGFRVSHDVRRTTATHVEVSGTVYNEARADAVDVSVTVEALGAGGRVVSRGNTYVAARIPERGNADFVAKVPLVTGVTGYRASVTSYRFMPAAEQSP
jgi:hypothetical protein